MITSSDKTFSEDLQRAGHNAVVVFWAEWARECRDIPAFLHAAAARLGGAHVIAVNTDANPVTTHAYDVQRVPTIAILTPRGVAWRVEGAPDADALSLAWQQAQTTARPTAKEPAST